jgi:hypothetical protein
MNLKSLLGSALAVASLTAASVLGTVPAHAAVIDWTLWSSSTPGNAGSGPGSASGAAGGVGVSYAGEIESLVPNYPSWTPTSSYVGGVVGNAPPVAGGIIQLYGGSYGLTDTITFSQAVTDPVMAIWSLGAGGNTAEFSFVQPFSIQAGGPSAEYGGGPIVLCDVNGVCGAEGNGTIEFLGTYSQISWTTPVFENWYGFTVGVAQTPLPSTWTMLFVGFAGLGFFAYRGSKKNASILAFA